jgi:hypothetical protein
MRRALPRLLALGLCAAALGCSSRERPPEGASQLSEEEAARRKQRFKDQVHSDLYEPTHGR